MKIGSHVSMCAPDFVLGSVKEAISYGANAFMLYSGAPQNTRRQPLDKLKIKEAHTLMKEHGIPLENMIMHAPYIINLANTIKPETYEIAVSFLQEELKRAKVFGVKYVVLHPGSHVNAGEEAGLDSIVKGLDEAMQTIDDDIYIALETMAGKGSELGYCFEQLKYIKDHVKKSEQIKVCLDTCHIHDAGYDIHDFDAILDEFDRILSLEHLVCIHLNDSKNVQGAKKDRHANLGFGEIGFDVLSYIAHHEKLKDVVKILETPYVAGNAPYKQEIAMLKEKRFIATWMDE
ncbi:MAG: deoxyribonuclease IV [Erysipelotrichia bacterium]|nr:deoxyribonuclease IV [Erysipelotrichia bacterium]NCC54644.1 deoxyribonuclease IV [Erysipelotrichia bacterium]